MALEIINEFFIDSEVSNFKIFVDTSVIFGLGFSERMINGDLVLGGITFRTVLPSDTSNEFELKSSKNFA